METVHHIDGDKSHNSIYNLMLFQTKRAHTKYHYQNGDLKLKSGSNKKKLVNGKIKCSNCKKLKGLKEFVTKSIAYLGVVGTCKECEKEQKQRRKS